MSIGENIIRLRKAKNLTQEKLAEKMGVTFQAGGFGSSDPGG